MRTDFREERRWKIAIAYKLSSAVLEWHSVGDRETRKERGIVVDWSRPVHDESRDIDDVEMIIEHSQDVEEDIHEDSGERPFSAALISADYGSDDSDDEQELEKREVADALEPRTALEEALGHAERSSESTQPENDIRPKEEDVDDSSILQAMQLTTNTDLKQDQTPGPLTDSASGPGEMPRPDFHSGLKPTSDDPILGSDEILENTTGQSTFTSKQHQKPSVYSPLRGHIAYYDYDKLVLDFDDLYIHKSRDAASNDVSHDHHAFPTDISQIFPELPFTFIEPPTPSGPSNLLSEGKKKSEKRDRDDPHKRNDPTAFSKMTPMGVFMRTRPTLLAALNPAVRWEGDHWAGFDDAPIVPDFDAPHKILDEPTSSKILCVPFSPSLTPSQGLFDSGKPNLLIPDDDGVLPSTPRDPARRIAADALWTNQDDTLLKRLVEKYPKNWGLVADLFNSSRGAIVMEKRADWECKERYRSRWLGKERSEREFAQMAPPVQDGPSSSTSTRPLQSQITTRKRMASVSSSGNTSVTSATNFEPRKRRRHILMFETLRKVAKKREAAQKAAGGCAPFAELFTMKHCLTPL
jgi:chromatin modification-related protein VID21